ncbi:SDR family NAD(P)-dependent oxidoreductase [Thermoactinospora rubra]|uniref:SDR family NAD(P)-dependent oxidoreductase n=1 Tax=Thermoactinospora rubra TaxID=1088767 RepID=UPI000A0F5E20|nr:SDR family NAD(P)-dependent oxidoreductase [Thermoactinospora rubra]
MDMGLDGKVAVVTGGSKGIGLAVVRTLAAEGAKVVAVSRSAGAGVEEAGAVHVPADLMDPEAPARAVRHAAERFGGLDILVNNAGGRPPGVTLPRFGFLTPTDEDWRRMVEFNLLAPVRAIRAAIPLMLERGGGAIVNVSTTMARMPAPMNVDYTAAKAGLTALTKSLAEEYGPQGVRVNTVTPGPVRTAWWTEEGGAADVLAAATGADRDAVMDRVAPEMMRLLTGRLIDPQEVADVVALLVSPRSAGIVGADYVVDAGQLKEV